MFSRKFGSLHCIYQPIRCSTSGGKVYVKGSGLFGALGLGSSLSDEVSFAPLSLLNNLTEIKSVSASWGHSAAINTKGDVFVWGKCFDFSSLLRLNRISTVSSSFARIVARSSNSPIFGGGEHGYYPVPSLLSVPNVKDVHCTAGLTVLLKDSGEILAMGSNQWNQCGQAVGNNIHVYEPVAVNIPLCRKVDTGLQHVLALTREGEVWAWGKSNKGQLGAGKTAEPSKMPVKVQIVNEQGKEVQAVDISAVISSEGEVYVWGKQMSLQSKSSKVLKVCEDQFTPRLVPLSSKAVEIVSSNFALVIRTEEGKLWGMGMGEGDRNMISTPLPITIDQKDNAAVLYTLSPKGWLKKSSQRVFVHTGERGSIYEVVLHQEEAFLLPWVGNTFLPESVKDKEIIDYSAGWKHELLVLK